MDYQHPPLPMDELEELFREWQRRLQLSHWDLCIERRRERDMSCTNARGCLHYNGNKLWGRIELLDPADWVEREEQDIPYDEEYTIIHELVHCWLVPWEGNANGEANVSEEQAVHRITQALIALKRANPQTITFTEYTQPGNGKYEFMPHPAMKLVDAG